MKSIFPLMYALLLFCSLGLFFVYFIGQFQNNLNLERQLSTFEKKLQQSKNSSDYAFKLGQLYLSKKCYAKAISLFQNALCHWDLQDKIGLGSLYNTLGFTYYKLNDYAQATYYYGQAIKVLPDYTLAFTNLGLAYENQQNYKEAYKVYTYLLAYDSQNTIATSRLPQVKQKYDLRLSM